MERDFEYDEYGNKFGRLYRPEGCGQCSNNCFKAVQTLKKCGYTVEVFGERISEFKRVRDVTHEEHGITKPYKGVYACIICGDEQIMDNSLEKEEVVEDETT